jgi:hypothetical protein
MQTPATIGNKRVIGACFEESGKVTPVCQADHSRIDAGDEETFWASGVVSAPEEPTGKGSATPQPTFA